MRFKTLISVVVTTAILLGSTINVFAGTIPKVYLNNMKVMMTSSPFNEGDMIYIPLKPLCETMGIDLIWGGGVLTLQQGKNKIVTAIRSPLANVNGETINFSDPLRLVNETTYVPASFIANVFKDVKVSILTDINALSIDYKFPTDKGFQFDRFGRLIRTTNLPSNSWEYPNIIAGIPMRMYEKNLKYNSIKWFKEPVEGIDFIRPVNVFTQNKYFTDENILTWTNSICENLTARLDVDYRNVSHPEWVESWVDALAETYSYKDKKNYTDSMKEYLKMVEDQELIIDGDFHVEPSIMYYTSGTFIRAWIKFIVKSDKVDEAIIYSRAKDGKVKTNQWYEGYIDFGIAGNTPNSDGSDYKIYIDSFGTRLTN